MFDGLLFFEFLTPSTLGGHNIINFISFLMIFSALEVPIGKVQVFSYTKKNGTFPLDMACLEYLNVIVATQLQLNLQVRNN